MNKLYCVTISFLQYILIEVKGIFKKENFSEIMKDKSFITHLLLGSFIGIAIGLFISWITEFFRITDYIATAVILFLGIAVIIDILFVIGFLYVNWRKAIKDCWDK